MKRKYRYNNKLKKWDEVFTFNTDLHVVCESMRPDGRFNSFTLLGDSPMANYYRNNGYFTPMAHRGEK